MTSDRTLRVALLGVGNVMRAFLSYWKERQFGLDLRIVSILRSRGVWQGEADAGVDLDRLEYQPGLDPFEGANFVIEALPSVYPDGVPATELLRKALDRGLDALTVNKGPLVAGFGDLRRRARDSGARFRFCVDGALPAVDTAVRDLRGATLTSLRAIANSTTNFVLTEMECGRTFDDAVRLAVERGIAEPDPALDLDGVDTAAKMVIMVNAAVGTNFRLDEVRVEGIRAVDPRIAQKSGRTWKLVGIYDGESIRVGPKLYGKDDIFYSVRGTAKIVEFETEEMGRITIMGGASGRTEMAAAMTREILNMYLT